MWSECSTSAGRGAHPAVPQSEGLVTSEIRATRSIRIGSKGRHHAPSRYFALDEDRVMPVGSDHRANEKATPARLRQESTRVAIPEQGWNDFTSSDLFSPRAGRRVSDHRIQDQARTPRAGTLDSHSHSVSKGVNERASLLSVQRDWSPIKAMKWCLKGLINGHTDVVVRSEGTNLSVGGVALCRNPLCPWCSYKRSMESAEILSKGLIRAKKKGFFVRLLTLTIPSGGDYAEQRSLLSGSLRRFSKKFSKEMKKQGAEQAGVSWSFDITMKMARTWRSHLHIHSCVVSDSMGVDEGTLFEWWNDAVSKEAGRPVQLSRRAFYARVPHSEKSVSAYVLGKFLRSAIEVQASSQKDGGKVGGGLGWKEFLRYIKATGDAGAGMLYKSIIEANKGKWWSSIGQTIKALALEEEEENPSDEATESLDQVEVVEVEIYGRDWSVLSRVGAGIETLLFVIQNREKHPNRFALVREWIAKMRASKWLTDEEIEQAWRVALGV